MRLLTILMVAAVLTACNAPPVEPMREAALQALADAPSDAAPPDPTTPLQGRWRLVWNYCGNSYTAPPVPTYVTVTATAEIVQTQTAVCADGLEHETYRMAFAVDYVIEEGGSPKFYLIQHATRTYASGPDTCAGIYTTPPVVSEARSYHPYRDQYDHLFMGVVGGNCMDGRPASQLYQAE